VASARPLLAPRILTLGPTWPLENERPALRLVAASEAARVAQAAIHFANREAGHPDQRSRRAVDAVPGD